MISPIVPPIQTHPPDTRATPPYHLPAQRMDPLSEVLALMKPQLYVAGGFAILDDIAIHFPKHAGIKCYAMLAGQCWLVVDTVPVPVLLQAGCAPRQYARSTTSSVVPKIAHAASFGAGKAPLT